MLRSGCDGIDDSTDFVCRGLSEAIGKEAGAGAVDFGGSGFGEDAMCVGARDAAAREDGKTSHFLGKLYEGTELGYASFGGGGSARGEDASNAHGRELTK